MSGHSVNKIDAIRVRLDALRCATDLINNTLSSTKVEPGAIALFVTDLAKKLETFAWGLHAPIEDAPTPLNTIEEALEATKMRAREWLINSPDMGPYYRDKMNEVLSMLERVTSEINTALGGT